MDNFSPEKFRGSIDLLKESWQIFSSKAKTLLAIAAIPVIFRLLTDILFFFYSPSSTLVWIVWTLFLLFFLFFQLLVIPSLLFALKENLFLKEAYQKGLKFFISYLWIYFLVIIIVAGGFLLFIIPGIIFSIWFSLAMIVFVFEEKRGLSALFQSKQLIVGRWWRVFWRLLVFYLIFGTIFLIFNLFFFNVFSAQISEKFNYLFQLFILPFGLIYHFLIYKNLKEIKVKEISSQDPQSKKREIKYVIFALLGLLIIVPMVGFAILNVVFGKDEPPPHDKDLLLSKVEISTTENALYHFLPYYNPDSKKIILEYWPEAEEKLKESKEIYWPDDMVDKISGIIGGKEWDEEDEELVKDIVEKNNEFFEDFDRFIQSPYFQDPVFRDPASFRIDLPLLSLGEYRTFARLNLLRATYLFQKGKEKEAFDETVKVIKMGQMFQESPLSPLIYYLTGMAIKGMGLESLRAMIKETDLSVDLLKFYIKELDQFYPDKEGLAKIFKGEYITLMNAKAKFIDAAIERRKISEEDKETLQDFFPSRLTPLIRFPYFYKPNQTKRIFAEEFRQKVEIAREGRCGGLWIESLLPYSKPKLFFTENLIGKVFHDITMVSLGGLFKRKCQEDFSVGGTQLLMAIKAYKIENNKMPDSLDQLVPKYITEIPRDPFDKKSIRYSPEKKIIYSVGSDLIDSGGSKEEGWTTAVDPTFKIEF